MDRSQVFELAALGRQKFMNAVIDEGNSPIQQFYSGATIFVTGGGGFLGKQLIEKLVRACKVKKIYLLMRSKKGKTVQERLEYMLKDPVYDTVRLKQPNFGDLIEVMEGDAAELSLGLSDLDCTRLTEEVDFIIHMAATTNFNAALREATLINVRGARECVALARACKKLRCFTHVSTAYTHATDSRIGTEIKEQFYPCPMPPDEIIQVAENIKSMQPGQMTVEMLKGWPNTYTFTKAIAEEFIRISTADLPVCIVKPPIVVPTLYEPSPGWLDHGALFGPSGLILGIILGVIHVLPIEVDKVLNFAPVDYVNNAIIAATWDTCERQKLGALEGVPIYAISSSKLGLVWDFMGSVFRAQDTRKLASPSGVWFGYLYETTNPVLYWLMTWVVHYIPAYIADGVCKVLRIEIKGVSSFKKMYEKVFKMAKLMTYFLNRDWYFNDENLTDMICRMSGKDRDIFNCDIYNIDYGQFVKVWVIGLRKYIIKDGLKDTEKGCRKQKWFCVANVIYLSLFAYIVYLVLYFCYFGIKYIIYYVGFVHFYLFIYILEYISILTHFSSFLYCY